jgi:O-antigen ligase
MTKFTSILQEGNKKTNRLHLLLSLLFLALCCFPLFPFKITNIILILLSALTLMAYIFKPVPLGKTILRNLVFILPFTPYLVEYCIFGFNHAAHFEFEKKIFFFTAPFFIPLFIQITGFKNYKIALLTFALSVSALSIYSLINLLIHGIPFFADAYINGAFLLRENFEQVSGLHPTYYSIFALTSACYLFFASASAKGWARYTSIALALLLIIIVLFLAVRIAFITGVIFLFIWILNSKRARLKKTIFTLSALVLITIISFSVPSLKNRLGEFVSWRTGQNSDVTTVTQRTTILECSLKLFSKNFLFGTGSRNSQQDLNDIYKSEGWSRGAEQSFNPHNQYLSIGINYGLLMLLIFITCLFIIFRKIVEIPEGKYFALAVLLFFLSESMIERQMGVYFFGLIALLLFNTNQDYKIIDIAEDKESVK